MPALSPVPLLCMAVLCCLSPAASSQAATFDPATALDRITTLIQDNYAMRERVPALLDHLRRQRGRYVAIRDPMAFASALTEGMRVASNDRHVYLRASAPGKGALTQPADWQQAERDREVTGNHGFDTAQVLSGNIGYLRISEFTEPQRGLPTLSAAMHFLAHTRALIVDVRGNPGGYGGLAEQLASYWFDPEPVLLTSVRFQYPKGKLLQTWSSPAVDGERRTGTPLLILTDAKTGSAAEWFSYTLQTTGKAKTVGETTSGGANMNEFFDIAPGLRLSLSVGRPESAVTGGSWEGRGVVADYPVAGANALARAQQILGHGH